ncbi:MAG: hypothetical protein V7L20_31255 [Nostoc sp.]|uniref:hypothetical protein n=1 Tax=Nostoc sp. TaxID=1180 RepID=UPI002FF5BFE1
MLACMAIAFFFLSLRIHVNGKAIALSFSKKVVLTVAFVVLLRRSKLRVSVFVRAASPIGEGEDVAVGEASRSRSVSPWEKRRHRYT